MLAVGSGASLGRDQAPGVLTAVGTELLIRSGSLPPEQRRMVLGGAAGAGLAGAYDVPAAGALFTLGIVLRSWRPSAILVAVATSSLATVAARPVSPGAPTFDWPSTDVTGQSAWATLAVMPVAALAGVGFNQLMSRSRPPAPPKSWILVRAIGLAGLVTGLASIWLPEMPVSGRSVVLESLSGTAPLAIAAIALLLKPALTALFIRCGAVGGMITPALATGAATGAFVALCVQHFGGHASVPATALVGGVAVLGVTQPAPLFAAVFTAELTHPPLDVCAVLLLAPSASTERVGSTVDSPESNSIWSMAGERGCHPCGLGSAAGGVQIAHQGTGLTPGEGGDVGCDDVHQAAAEVGQ